MCMIAAASWSMMHISRLRQLARWHGVRAAHSWPSAVIEVTDESETFSVLVHGLTGRVQLKDGALENVNEHMMRNIMGDKDAERDAEGNRE